MRIEELKGKTNEEQSKLIAECPICKMEEALDNPKVLEKKILVFKGNYDGFCTDRLCARIVEYIPSKDRWQISDVILFDMDGTGYWHHFTKDELKFQFSDLCKSTGFMMEL